MRIAREFVIEAEEQLRGWTPLWACIWGVCSETGGETD
jgi:hypothetical protein